MELHDYPAGIERARLALGPVRERLRAVRNEQASIRAAVALRVLTARDAGGRRAYRFEAERKVAVAVALSDDPRFAALRAEEEALDHVREQCQARLERLRHEFDLATRGQKREGGAN